MTLVGTDRMHRTYSFLITETFCPMDGLIRNMCFFATWHSGIALKMSIIFLFFSPKIRFLKNHLLEC